MKAGLWGGMWLTERECKARPGRGLGCSGPEWRLTAWGVTVVKTEAGLTWGVPPTKAESQDRMH